MSAEVTVDDVPSAFARKQYAGVAVFMSMQLVVPNLVSACCFVR